MVAPGGFPVRDDGGRLRDPALEEPGDPQLHRCAVLHGHGAHDDGLRRHNAPGTVGRLISVVIMIFGVTLFLRLVRALLQPQKVRFACPRCGLQRHDFDAVHCKACGTILNIPDEGLSP